MLRPFHALSLVLLLSSGAAEAQITYAYFGQPYDANGAYISGFIEVLSPIAPNTTSAEDSIGHAIARPTSPVITPPIPWLASIM
jgi:hypothetical protein